MEEGRFRASNAYSSMISMSRGRGEDDVELGNDVSLINLPHYRFPNPKRYVISLD